MKKILAGIGVVAIVLGLLSLLEFRPVQPEGEVQQRIEPVSADNFSVESEDLPLRFGRIPGTVAPGELSEPATEDYAQLPRPEVPLAQALPELIRRAEAGEPAASCRLTLELLRCQDQFTREKRLREMENFLTKEPGTAQEERFVGMIATREEKFSALSAHCRGTEDVVAGDVGRFLEAAVAHLSPRQKTLLAMARPDGLLDRMPRSPRDILPVELDTSYVYPQFLAENAYSFLQAGIASADPLALEGMLMVHSPSWIPGVARDARISLPNARLFSYYALVQIELFGAESLGTFGTEILAQSRQALPPSDLQRIQNKASEEARRWLAVSSARKGSEQLRKELPPRESPVCF